MSKSILLAIRTMTRYARKETAIYLLAVILGAAAAPLTLIYIEEMIDAACAGERVLPFLLGVCICSLVAALMNWLANLAGLKIKRRLYGEFSENMLAHFMEIEYACYEDAQALNLIRRMGKSPQENILKFMNEMISLLSILIKIAGYSIIFVRLSPWFLLIGLLVMGIMLRLDLRCATLLTDLYEEQTLDERLMDEYGRIISDKTTLYDLRVAGAVDYLLKKRKKISDRLVEERRQRTFVSQRAYVYGNLTAVLWMALVFAFLIRAIVLGTITVGFFISLAGAVRQILSCMRSLGDHYTKLTKNGVYMEYYRKFMEMPARENQNAAEKIKTEHLEIEFEHVTFTYPGNQAPALRDVSFVIPADAKTALVGHNGSGKTTLVKLLCGLYQPDSGHIRINGRDIREIDRDVLLRCFSVVFQDYGRYSFTVRENVLLGDVSRECDDARMKEALSQGLAESLGQDLNRKLGNLEGGTDLSGGQWQRLALSRACYRESPMMILDEPTASMDPVAENEMYSNFMRMMAARSCILISHRLAIAQYTDTILVLDHGRLAEQGNHEQLMKRGGIYASMYKAQSHWYEEEAFECSLKSGV